MKSLLIDPYTRTISEIERKDDLESLYTAVGTRDLDFRKFDGGHFFIVDDIGLLKSGLPVFRLGSYPDMLAGKCLICGADDDGVTVDVKLTVDRLTALVQWTNLETTSRIAPTTQDFDEVRKAHVIRVGAGIFREREKP